MRLFEFDKFTENDLHRVYLFASSDKFSFSHIDSLVRSVSQKMFQLLTPPGIFADSIDKTLPVFNYGNKEEIKKLIEDGVIERKNVYNQPENLVNANSKVEFHKKTAGMEFIPKTVYSKEEASSLKFPIIAKTEKGSKGEGVEVFKTIEELNASTTEFGVFSEKFDLDKEFRCISIKGQIVFIAERIPENEKANSLREEEHSEDIFDRKGTLDKRSAYEWKTVEMGQDGLPAREVFENVCRLINEKLGLEFLGVDIGIDKQGKLFCIEANTCPGLNKDQVVLIYEKIFEDFYKRKVSPHTQKTLDQFKDELMRANQDPAKFSHSPHMGRKFYHYNKHPDQNDPEAKKGDPSVYSVKFDLEKSFGKPLKDIKQMKHLKEFKGWTSTSTDSEEVPVSYDFVPANKTERKYYGIHKVTMKYENNSITVDAKFDTGAKSSSISTELARQLGVPDHIIEICKTVTGLKGPDAKKAAKKLVKQHGLKVRLIKNATGVTVRAYVPLTISYDGRTITTAANVIDRSGLKANALIGLNDM